MSELLVSAIDPDTRLCDRFRVRAKIGDGAAASVYRALDEHSNTEVALKILDPLRGTDPVGRMRFEREFEVLSKVSHPAIARCREITRHEDLDLLVLELIEGETLAQRLARGALPVDEALRHGGQAAQALAACHAAGVIHRDLKPANIMLHPDRGAVLLDFGVAWFSSAANLTRTGAVVGSPQYIAPEVFSSSLHDARSDVYSLGVILFEMFTGRPVFPADTIPALIELQRKRLPPTVMSLRPEVGPELSKIVGKAIAVLPEARFATAEELRHALDRRALVLSHPIVDRLPCKTCQTPLIVDLPFCGGCGEPVSWSLRPGHFAVQLTEVPNPARAAAWIRDRHGYAFRGVQARLLRRFAQTPVPLVVDAAEESALQLASEAKAMGIQAEVIQAHTVLGAKLQIAGATFLECIAAMVLHYLGVVVLGGLFGLLGARFVTLAWVPVLVGFIGMLVARLYVRRPILEIPKATGPALLDEKLRPLREALKSLKHPRARRLAAGALSRVAPVLLGDTKGLATEAPADAEAALDRALVAIGAADLHLERLDKTSRARLGADLAAARARLETNVEGAVEEVARLEQERQELYEAAVAHDLAVREALDATEAISQALSTRTLAIDAPKWPSLSPLLAAGREKA